MNPIFVAIVAYLLLAAIMILVPSGSWADVLVCIAGVGIVLFFVTLWLL